MILVQILGLQSVMTTNNFKLRQQPTWEHFFFLNAICPELGRSLDFTALTS